MNWILITVGFIVMMGFLILSFILELIFPSQPGCEWDIPASKWEYVMFFSFLSIPFFILGGIL